MSTATNVLELAATVLQSGIHKGQRFDQVPAFYLDWLAGVQWMPSRFPDVHARLVEYLELPEVRARIVANRSRAKVVAVPGKCGEGRAVRDESNDA
jgi:hypothetical protein